MKRLLTGIAAALILTGAIAIDSAAKATVGQPAPAFTGKGSDGKDYSLSDYKGKFVVLQWYNKDCPFIVKHYKSGNMQKLQADYGAKGVIWLEVISSAPGKQGYLTAAEAEANRRDAKVHSAATLLDPEGKLGMLYGAKTTPHIFIVDPQGKLIYQGAIDDHNSADADDIPTSKNYVAAALDEAMAGKPVSVPSTSAYGCSVKYK